MTSDYDVRFNCRVVFYKIEKKNYVTQSHSHTKDQDTRNCYRYTMGKTRCYDLLTPEVRAYIKLSKGFKSAAELVKECKVSRAHVYRIWNSDIVRKKTAMKKSGRPRKINARTERELLRLIPKMRSRNNNWSVAQLIQQSSLKNSGNVHSCTVNRVLNKNGFWHLQMRKKGLLSEKDKKQRFRFARNMLRRPDSSTYWISGISFYLDASSFIYKKNPREYAAAPSGRCFRKKSEGLSNTAKGSVCGTGGKYVRVIACISHQKGVVWASTYEKMSGLTFATFVRQNFNTIFERCGKESQDVYIWLQDGDTSQNSKEAREAMQEVHANVIQHIPPRSPDLNPIENVFNVVKKQLKDEAIEKNIENESKEEYEKRVLSALLNYPSSVIDRTIESMEKRLKLVVKGRGNRTKY